MGRKTHFWTTELKQYRHGCAVRRPAGNKKQDTFSSTAGARPTIPTMLDMVIEKVRAVFAPSTVQFTTQTVTHQGIFVYHNQHGRPRRREENNRI